MTNHRKVLISVLLGLAGLGASFFSPAFHFPPHTITITWFHLFPLLAAMAYGPRYGVITGVCGLVALHPFLSWPSNGWANLVPVFFELTFYIWQGYAAEARRKKPAPWNQPFIAQIPFAVLYAAAVLGLYPVLFALNPPFWMKNAATSMPLNVIIEVNIKTVITMYGCVLLAQFVLMTPMARQFLELPRRSVARFNGKILLASVGGMVTVWILWQTLNSIFVKHDFPQGIFQIGGAVETITLIVMIVTCLVGGYVVALYVEKRYAAEETLQRNEVRYRTLFESANDAIFLMRGDFFIECNERTTTMFRCRRDQIIGRSPIDFSPERQADGKLTTEAAAQRIASALAGEPQRFEWRHIRLDKTPFDAEVSLNRIEFEGEVLLQAIVRDITNRKLAEEKLRKSDERVRLFFERQLVGMAITSPQKEWLQVNERLCQMLGYSRAELTRLTWTELTYPEDLAGDMALYNRMMAGEIDEYQREKRYVRKDGVIVYCNLAVTCVRRPDRGVDYILALLEDTTERKRAADALRESESKLRAIFESSRDAIGVSKAGIHIFANPAYLKMFGYKSNDDIVGTHIMDHCAPSQREKLRSIVERRARGQEAPNFYELRGIRTDGVEFDVEINAATYELDGQTYTLATIRDVSQRKQAEALMIETEKLRTVAGLAAGVAHEINNPVAAMVQNAQVIQSRLSADGPANRAAAERHGLCFETLSGYLAEREIPETLEAIRSAGRQASSIVRNLLAYSRRDTTKSAINFSELIDRTLELAASDYELKKHNALAAAMIEREYAAEPVIVYAHDTQIQQVIINLVRNAMQAMRNNPPERPAKLRLKTSYQEGFGCLTIEDNGPGISEEVSGKLFEPFVTTKPEGEGTGLGLFVSYHIIRVTHGGNIRAESIRPNGSAFTISLPAYGAWSNSRDARIKS